MSALPSPEVVSAVLADCKAAFAESARLCDDEQITAEVDAQIAAQIDPLAQAYAEHADAVMLRLLRGAL